MRPRKVVNHYPDIFFCYPEINDNDYKEYGPGLLNASRLISQGQKAWKKASLVRKKHPKTLLLANLKHLDLSQNKSALEEKIHQLLSDGFTIHAVINDSIIPVTKETLSKVIERLPEALMDYPKTINETAAKTLRIPIDQLMLIDEFWIEGLLNPALDPKRTREMVISNFSRHKEKEIEILMQSEPPLQRIILEEVRPLTLASFKKIIPASLSYQVNSIVDNDENALNSISSEDLAQVSSIVSPFVNLKFLESLKNYNKLNSLHLRSSYSNAFEFVDSKSSDLSHLIRIKTFKMSRISEEDKHCIALLNKTKELESLSLLCFQEIGWDKIPLEENSLLNLQEMTLNISKLPADCLYQFMMAAPNLQECSLMFVSLKGIKLKNEFLKLKKIKLNQVDCSGEDVANILFVFPNLAEIEFETQGKLENFKLNRELLSLKSVIFNNVAITGEDLQHFISRAHKIEKLKLEGCKKINGFNLEEVKLPFLREAVFNDSLITASDLAGLFKSASNLKSLSLVSCDEIKETKDSLCKLPKLEFLELMCSNQAPEMLEKLFNAVENVKILKFNYVEVPYQVIPNFLMKLPKLEELEISHDTSLFQESEFKNVSFPELRSVTISSEIETNALCRFVQACPKLEVLNVYSWAPSKPITSAFGSLASLKELSIIGPKLDIDEVILVLKKCPNLEKLYIGRVSMNKDQLFKIFDTVKKATEITINNCPIDNKAEIEASNVLSRPSAFEHSGPVYLSAAEGDGPHASAIASDSGYEMCEMFDTPLIPLEPGILLFDDDKPSSPLFNAKSASMDNVDKRPLPPFGPDDSESDEDGFRLAPGMGDVDGSDDDKSLISLSAPSTPAPLLKLKLENMTSYIDLPLILKKMPHLKVLSLSESRCIINEINNTEIEELDLARTDITMALLRTIIKNNPKLRKIDLTGCDVLKWPSSWLHSEEHKALASKIDIIPLYDPILASLRPAEDKIARQEVKHDFQEHLDRKPNNEPFVYKGIQSKKQAMIIEKLSQYMLIKGDDPYVIQRIQNGMCYGLTYEFFINDLQAWDRLINKISDWDGRPQNLTPLLESMLAHLREDVVERQLGRSQKYRCYYIGDSLSELLQYNKIFSVQLDNPWHAATLKRISIDSEPAWVFYDPEFESGYKKLSSSEIEKVIKNSLGNLIQMTHSDIEIQSEVKPKITDPSVFIFEGGLLSLSKAENKLAILSLLNKPIRNEALMGLFLRHTDGVPAWLSVLRNNHVESSNFTVKLLKQFIQHNLNYAETMAKSVDCLTPLEQEQALGVFCQTTGIYNNVISAKQPHSSIFTSEEKKAQENPIDVIKKAIEKNSYEDLYTKGLATWETEAKERMPLSLYIQSLLRHDPEKLSQLVKVDSEDAVFVLQTSLQSMAEMKNQPIFIVKSPSELQCSSKWTKRGADNKGAIEEPPGGPLYEFLNKNKDKNPIIVVNYDHFSHEDFIRYNGLLDDPPALDKNILLPPGAKVIGLMNTKKPDCYMGSDFHGRIKYKENCPVDSKFLVPEKIPFVDIETESKSAQILKCYHQDEWKEKLLGSWKIQGDELEFVPGSLKYPLQENEVLEIHQGLWQNTSFKQFWQEAYKLGKIEHEGLCIPFPKSVRIKAIADYAWPDLIKHATLIKGVLPGKYPVLNATLVNNFFEQYENKENKLYSQKGIIAQYAGTTLEINMTSAIMEDQWAQLLDECREHKVKLIVHAANIQLPDVIKFEETKAETKSSFQPHTRVINSTDIDVTISQLTKDQKSWHVIDVSELNMSDLLTKLDNQWLSEEKRFSFSTKKQFLLKALKKKKNVILKGRFSSELEDALAPLILARSAEENARGQLLLLPDDFSQFNYMPITTHEVTVAEKVTYLNSCGFELKQAQVDELKAHSTPACQLRAILSHQQKDFKTSAWEGIKTIPKTAAVSSQQIDYKNSKAIAKAFTAKRIETIKKVLATEPFVLLTGLTGIGKTTLVEKDFKAKLGPSDKLYIGEDAMLQWATEGVPGIKYLFIDESNLSHRLWTEFEGLYNKPPGILINGKYYPLSDSHKVIFAGNPAAYSHDRQLSPFFERHGNAVLFERLPLESIYEDVLKPLFANQEIAKYQQLICDIIFNIYKVISDYSVNEVLISPRELQSMVLMVMQSLPKNEAEAKTATKYYAYLIGKNSVPESRLAEFNAAYECTMPFTVSPEKKSEAKQESKDSKPSSFLVTKSRHETVHLLENFLHLRAWRSKDKGLNKNKAQKYGGLGGIILEGIPAAGKSELVKHCLLANGYIQKKNAKSKVKPGQRIFYYLPVEMDLQLKQELLLKAFREGSVVLIDEINSCPMMERLLNALLMGKDLNGNSPKYPGFMLIGTQNPAESMPGRTVASNALLKRLVTVKLPPYPPTEITDIFAHKGLPSNHVTQLTNAYQKQTTKAHTERLSPAPTLRDALRLAEKTMKHHVAPSLSSKITASHTLNLHIKNI